MKTNVFLGIGLRIIILFTVTMFMTYIPEHLTGFFGDYMSEPEVRSWGTTKSELVWGARHYWYNVMIIILFILALLNVVLSIRQLLNKNYDTTKW